MRREWGRRRSADGGYRLILGRFLAAPDSLVVRVYPPYMPDNNGKVSLEREGGGKERERDRERPRALLHPGHELSLRKHRRDWN